MALSGVPVASAMLRGSAGRGRGRLGARQRKPDRSEGIRSSWAILWGMPGHDTSERAARSLRMSAAASEVYSALTTRAQEQGQEHRGRFGQQVRRCEKGDHLGRAGQYRIMVTGSDENLASQAQSGLCPSFRCDHTSHIRRNSPAESCRSSGGTRAQESTSLLYAEKQTDGERSLHGSGPRTVHSAPVYTRHASALPAYLRSL